MLIDQNSDTPDTHLYTHKKVWLKQNENRTKQNLNQSKMSKEKEG